MIRFQPSSAPPLFAAQVTNPGNIWLSKHPDKRPKDFWGAFKPQLAEAFGNLCAYSAMYEPVGTVDHFVSCDEDRNLAYEWSNYRYASGWINSSKQNLPSDTLLDSFAVGHSWFEILLPSLQLVTTNAIPQVLQARAEFVLKRLHLRDDERVLRQRREWYRMYQEGELTLDGLRKKAPLIAAAVEKQNKARSRQI